MIVVCGNCDTRFQLDDERVPESGIRVRCSRCKEAFFLQHPSASQSQAVDAVVEDAVHGGGAPGTTQDLTGPSPAAEPAIAAPAEAVADAPPGATDEAEDEESDWEFNDDDFAVASDEPEPEADPEPEAFTADADDSPNDWLGDGSVDPHESAIETEAEAEGVEEMGAETDALPGLEQSLVQPDSGDSFEPPDGAIGFDEEQAGLSPELDTAEPSGLATASEDADDDPFGAVDDFSSLADPDDDPAAVPMDAAAAAASSDASLDDDPEDWDFFSDESLAQTAPAAAAAATTPDPFAGPATTAAPAAEGAEGFDLPATPAAASQGVQAAERVGRIVGWTVTLALLATAVVHGLLLENPLLAAGPDVVSLGGLRATSIEGRWVERVDGRTLYVVRGMLENPGAKRVVPGASLRVALRSDGDAEPLATATAALRPGDAVLREGGFPELQARQQRGASALSWSAIEPGGRLPFTAVFDEVPEGAQRFALEVAPATKPRQVARVQQPARVAGPPTPPAAPETAAP